MAINPEAELISWAFLCTMMGPTIAFTASSAFVFGGHLDFVTGVNKDMVFAMIVGKLMGGFTMIVLASITTPKTTNLHTTSVKVIDINI